MALVTINLTDTFDEWRIKSNSLGSNTGDLSGLNTSDKTSIVAAINEIYSNDSDDMESLIDDTAPMLGGNLTLNNFDLIGTGNINISGSLTGNIVLSNNNITGTGNIDINGTITATSISGTTIGVTQTTNDNSQKLATTAYVDAQIVQAADGIDTISELTDTVISSVADNNVLAYNSATSKWENKTLSATGGTSTGFAVAIAIALG